MCKDIRFSCLYIGVQTENENWIVRGYGLTFGNLISRLLNFFTFLLFTTIYVTLFTSLLFVSFPLTSLLFLTVFYSLSLSLFLSRFFPVCLFSISELEYFTSKHDYDCCVSFLPFSSHDFCRFLTMQPSYIQLPIIQTTSNYTNNFQRKKQTKNKGNRVRQSTSNILKLS